ncbi:hypothetical protein ISN45_Un97g000400 (mitochondrion) [Arabidopsis thaliana x Arabidopsis arenosa]|uniref:Uncharacterized protein n=1 Tax=Arabidopsis thaliana x Arabidopsis arenosa TaxID=1240361 RepID=A0A8T1XFM8_9BRAS|nr:hypothetical protein ISN45_Un97g000400 [Arabidopsis thaliana x Arabidopsis arenosa]
MNKKENGTIGFSCDSPPATCPKDQKPARRQWVGRKLAPYLGWGKRNEVHREGFNPATGSPTATLLRLHPSRRPHRGCDGRCVQGPGTYSPRHADPRLLAIPTSCSRVAENNPN